MGRMHVSKIQKEKEEEITAVFQRKVIDK